MFIEEKSVTLSDTRRIFLDDDNDIFLSLKKDNEILHTFEVSFPSGGYGGGTLMLSPSERYLLFSYYSGESEEAYALFEVQDTCLEPIYSSGYLCGEGASYLFSNHEDFLFQALPESVGPWYREDAEEDEKGRPFFSFCQINILNIQEKTAIKHNIQVTLPEHWDDKWAEGEAPYLMDIVGNNILRIAMPWGEKRLTLPLDEKILLNPNE